MPLIKERKVADHGCCDCRAQLGNRTRRRKHGSLSIFDGDMSQPMTGRKSKARVWRRVSLVRVGGCFDRQIQTN
ncbi:hypothetical protein KCU91_g15, partial [Aureobasidium melanogenum]